jgi:hypothetical protein
MDQALRVHAADRGSRPRFRGQPRAPVFATLSPPLGGVLMRPGSGDQIDEAAEPPAASWLTARLPDRDHRARCLKTGPHGAIRTTSI